MSGLLAGDDRPSQDVSASPPSNCLPDPGLIDEPVLVERTCQLLGYNTLAFFAPEPANAQDTALDAYAQR